MELCGRFWENPQKHVETGGTLWNGPEKATEICVSCLNSEEVARRIYITLWKLREPNGNFHENPQKSMESDGALWKVLAKSTSCCKIPLTIQGKKRLKFSSVFLQSLVSEHHPLMQDAYNRPLDPWYHSTEKEVKAVSQHCWCQAKSGWRPQ